MRKSRRARPTPVLFVFLPIALIAGITTWLWVRRDHPPVQEIYDARLYLNQARETAREEEVEPILASAKRNLDDAQAALQREYGKLVLFRDYDLARYHAGRSRDLCGEAITTARTVRLNLAETCAKRLASLRHSVQTTRGLVNRLTVRGDALVRLTAADALLSGASQRLVEHEPGEARQLLNQAEEELQRASANLHYRMTRFLERRQEWNTWIRETLAASGRSSEPMLLVDKLNHECYILRQGRVVESFAAEFGNGWMERKLVEGDRATPEGRYQVSALKGRGNSRYYKAALLDYPNQTDRSRFVEAKREGRIPNSARIGGLIEIHGEGGRGSNWTSGCISLANSDMDRLMSFLRVGTPVTIVGVWQEPSWLSNGDLARSAIGAQPAD